MRSVYDAIKPVASLVSATRTADANGTAVDTLGYNSAALVIQAGDIDLANAGEYMSYIFLADYHALTTVRNGDELRKQTFEPSSTSSVPRG
jgi:hypothetical protein